MPIHLDGPRHNLSALLLAMFAVQFFSQGQAHEKSDDLPARILIIRHAEKPPVEDKSVHLNAEGQERAEALHGLFKASATRPDPFPIPDFIFAAKDSKNSRRPEETVTPLAKKLKLTIDTEYRDEDFAKLTDEIFKNPKYSGKTILICWHHGLAAELARGLRAADAPASWQGSVFDRVWEITYDKSGNAVFHDRPQHLMSKDSEQ